MSTWRKQSTSSKHMSVIYNYLLAWHDILHRHFRPSQSRKWLTRKWLTQDKQLQEISTSKLLKEPLNRTIDVFPYFIYIFLFHYYYYYFFVFSSWKKLLNFRGWQCFFNWNEMFLIRKKFFLIKFKFFFMKITFIFPFSEMFRHVPECFVFRVLWTPICKYFPISVIPNSNLITISNNVLPKLLS